MIENGSLRASELVYHHNSLKLLAFKQQQQQQHQPATHSINTESSFFRAFTLLLKSFCLICFTSCFLHQQQQLLFFRGRRMSSVVGGATSARASIQIIVRILLGLFCFYLFFSLSCCHHQLSFHFSLLHLRSIIYVVFYFDYHYYYY